MPDNGYEAFSTYAPPKPFPQAGEGYEAFGSYTPPKPKAGREVSGTESALRGLGEGVSFGFSPALEGVAAASGVEAPKTISERASGAAARRPLQGLWNLLQEHREGAKPGPATAAYDKAREEELKANEQAYEQHPGAYIGGQVGGSLLAPLGGATGGVTAAGRIGRAAASGAIGGGLGGAGTAISGGASPISLDTVLGATEGAGLGVVLGGAGGAILEGGRRAFGRAGDIYRGAVNAENQAARGVAGARAEDVASGRPAGLDPEAEAAAGRAGLPILNIDRGGETTRSLGRVAGDTSPQAWAALEQATTERKEARPERLSQTINRLFGGNLDAGADRLRLEAEGRRANAPRYERAYDAGDRPIWSDELERLVSAPSIRQAMASAVKSGQDRAAEQGFGAFNPGVQVTPDGRLRFTRTSPTGGTTYPNLQYWDYVQRDLADMVEKVQGREPDKARYLNGLHQQLNSELDRLVPEFQDARVGAWRYFQAQDASEAGRKFVRMDADPREARRAMAQMTRPDRELFSRAFADELSQAVLKRANTLGTIKQVFTSPMAAQKIRIALDPNHVGAGPGPRARELEALLRAETVAEKSKNALGNSQTTRFREMVNAFKQTGAAHGIAGAGAIGAFEFLHEGDFDPRSIIGTALIAGMVKGGAHKIDTRVMRRIGEMLASDNPAIVQRGAAMVAHSPTLFNALRRGTEAGTRITARDIGPARALAGSAAVLSDVVAHEEQHHNAKHPDNTDMSPLQ